jgi:S1-C subfamily serine protease
MTAQMALRSTALLLGLAAAAAAQDEPLDKARDGLDAPHVRVYRQVAPAVVSVRGGGQSGSGVIIDPSGIVLTSPTACGTSAETVTVTGRGNRQYRGRVMGRVNEKELVLVKIDARDLVAVELGDSDAAAPGQVVYVLGDSFGSILKDDQPAISLGVISGVYSISKKQRGSYYAGKVLETSAAVNPDQDGGPLVDRRGRLLGIMTLNYDESKFTGIAVPVNEIKRDIERIRREFEAGPAAAAPRKPGEAWLGAETRTTAEGLEVTRVSARSPAEKAGIRKGDVLKRAEDVRLVTRAALDKLLEKKSPGDVLKVALVRDGSPMELPATLAKKPVY